MALPQQAGQPPQQGAQPPQQGGAAPKLPQQPLTPEQMRQFQIMSKQAMGLLLEDQTAEMIVQRAQQGDPQQVVSEIVLQVLRQLYEAATQAGQQVDIVTTLVVGIQIIGTLAEMLIEAGVLQQAQAQQFITAVADSAIKQHNAQVQQGGAA